jgi:hypothetical protein
VLIPSVCASCGSETDLTQEELRDSFDLSSQQGDTIHTQTYSKIWPVLLCAECREVKNALDANLKEKDRPKAVGALSCISALFFVIAIISLVVWLAQGGGNGDGRGKGADRVCLGFVVLGLISGGAIFLVEQRAGKALADRLTQTYGHGYRAVRLKYEYRGVSGTLSRERELPFLVPPEKARLWLEIDNPDYAELLVQQHPGIYSKK